MPSGHPFQYPDSLELFNQINHLLNQNKAPELSFKQLIQIYSNHHEFVSCSGLQLVFDQQEFSTSGFKKTEKCFEQLFSSQDGKKGTIVLSLHDQTIINAEKSQLDLENFIHNLGNLIVRYLNRIGLEIQTESNSKSKSDQKVKSTINNQFLQKFLNKYTDNRDLYHDLMPFKVREILINFKSL